MQAKRKVLARFPNARLIERAAQHWSVQSGELILDTSPSDSWQGKKAAWRSAYFWCNRNPEKETPALPGPGVPLGGD